MPSLPLKPCIIRTIETPIIKARVQLQSVINYETNFGKYMLHSNCMMLVNCVVSGYLDARRILNNVEFYYLNTCIISIVLVNMLDVVSFAYLYVYFKFRNTLTVILGTSAY